MLLASTVGQVRAAQPFHTQLQDYPAQLIAVQDVRHAAAAVAREARVAVAPVAVAVDAGGF